MVSLPGQWEVCVIFFHACIRLLSTDRLTSHVPASAVGANSVTNISARPIPQEPMV